MLYPVYMAQGRSTNSLGLDTLPALSSHCLPQQAGVGCGLPSRTSSDSLARWERHTRDQPWLRLLLPETGDVLAPQVCRPRSAGGRRQALLRLLTLHPRLCRDSRASPVMGRVDLPAKSLNAEREAARETPRPSGHSSWDQLGPPAPVSAQARLLRSMVGVGKPQWPSWLFSSVSSFWSQVTGGLR